jgi:N-hydroxyarylamine O-acetyltransferase
VSRSTRRRLTRNITRVLEKYLARLGVGVAGRQPGETLLAELQLAHLIAVPFENLDVFHRRGVRTGIDWSLPKIVERSRGGWCFEVNGAFGWLLRQVGFEVDYVSCRVLNDDGWGPEFDHCALVVRIDGQQWFVDVGFGDCCMCPIPLVNGEHDGIPRPVRCRIGPEGFVITERMLDGTWEDQLSGSFTPVTLDAFTPRCDYLQTTPGLSWSEKVFATRATAAEGSRITLRAEVLRTRVGVGEFVEQPVAPDEWSGLLNEHFGLVDSRLNTRTDTDLQ